MKRRLMLAISVTTVMIVAAACGGGSSGSSSSGGSSSAGAAQDGGNIVIARVAESLSMDNTTVFDNESIWIFQQMYETLYTVSPDGKSVIPWLAKSYDLSPDQLTYTFHLRDGVKFHNGQPDDLGGRQVFDRCSAEASARIHVGLHRHRHQERGGS